MFQIKVMYGWRVATPDEQLYHRPAGYIGFYMELLWVGLHFPLHKFLVELCKQHFKCAITQFSLNDIRWIL